MIRVAQQEAALAKVSRCRQNRSQESQHIGETKANANNAAKYGDVEIAARSRRSGSGLAG